MSDIDVLDEDGNKTTAVLDFKTVHDQSLWHLSVWIWAYDKDGRVSFQLRSNDLRHFPGLWAGSAAGHVDAGETSLEAAVRETHEEIGLEADPSRFELVMQKKVIVDTPKSSVKHKEFIDVYMVLVTEDEIGQPQASEVQELRWFNLDELKTELSENYDKFIPNKDHYLKMMNLVKERV